MYDIGDARLEETGYDARGEWKEPPVLQIVLPHSCDNWVIGGRAEAEKLIADLQMLVARSDW